MTTVILKDWLFVGCMAFFVLLMAFNVWSHLAFKRMVADMERRIEEAERR